MAYHDDLLEQAIHLTHRELRRPRQASLRRFISTAYYALFHLFVDEASKILIRGQNWGYLRYLVSRAFSHSEMKQASRSFVGGNLPTQIASLLFGSISSELRFVALTFIRLQETRHLADYDLSITYKRFEVETIIDQVEHVFAVWQEIRREHNPRLYLVCLMFWNRWGR